MIKYETKYLKQGYKCIAGIDEAGRGSWAGPIVVASCVLPNNFYDKRINDSKTMSAKKRKEAFELIKSVAIVYDVTFVDAQDVDKLNPKQASIFGMQESLKKLKKPKPDIALIDAEKISSSAKTKSIIKGDSKSISIAAASILAKVARDEYMINISSKYPNFSFKKHKGYGTLLHLNELRKNGPIKNFHRFTYKPIQKVLNDAKINKQNI